MLGTLFSTPRSEPDHLLPAAGGTIVLALLLPVIALVGWSIAGWGLAALLWLGLHALDLLVVLFVALAADTNVALTAGLTYGLAYTFELGFSLVSYFGTPSL